LEAEKMALLVVEVEGLAEHLPEEAVEEVAEGSELEVLVCFPSYKIIRKMNF